MSASIDQQSDAQQIRAVLQQRAKNTREGRLDQVLENHSPEALIYDRASPQIGFAHGPIRCGGVTPSGAGFEDLVRATFCLANPGKGWAVVHQHISKPFHLKDA